MRLKGEVGSSLDRSKLVLLWIFFLYFMFVFVILYCLCHAAVWSLACKRLILCSPVCDVFSCFITFLYGILGQVWYLIISIPDLSSLLCYIWRGTVSQPMTRKFHYAFC